MDLFTYDPAHPEALIQVWGRVAPLQPEELAEASITIAVPLEKIPSLTGALMDAHRRGREIRTKSIRDAEDKKKKS